MEGEKAKAQAEEETEAKGKRDKVAPQWKEGLRAAWSDFSSKQTASLVYFILALLLAPLIGVFMSNPKVIIWGTALSFMIAIAVVAVYLTRHVGQPAPVESDTHGVLFPANDPSPPNLCERMGPIPPEAVSLFFGHAVAWTTQFPMTVLQVGGLNLIRLGKTEQGLTVSAQVFSADGRIIADLQENEFHINPNNYFRRERPDKSTLEVYDQQGRSVLRVRFLNPHAVRISGIFIAPNRRPVVITDERVDPLFGASNICIGQCVIAINVP